MSSPEDVEQFTSDDLALSYVQLRLAKPELGMLEAALEVGYASKPSPLARHLLSLALAAQENPTQMKAAIVDELERARRSLEHFKRRVRELERWDRALEAVTENSSPL